MRTLARVGRINFAFLLPILLAVSACRSERPEHPAETVRHDSASAIGSPSTHPDSIVTGVRPPVPPPAWTAPEMVGHVEQFLSTIHKGDRTTFAAMLSERSRKTLSDLHASDEIWGIATDALGSIQHQQISVIGGSRDSVALLIRGERKVEGEETNDPIVMSLLHEEGAWKVMYPGLQYPNNHLKR